MGFFKRKKKQEELHSFEEIIEYTKKHGLSDATMDDLDDETRPIVEKGIYNSLKALAQSNLETINRLRGHLSLPPIDLDFPTFEEWNSHTRRESRYFINGVEVDIHDPAIDEGGHLNFSSFVSEMEKERNR